MATKSKICFDAHHKYIEGPVPKNSHIYNSTHFRCTEQAKIKPKTNELLTGEELSVTGFLKACLHADTQVPRVLEHDSGQTVTN